MGLNLIIASNPVWGLNLTPAGVINKVKLLAPAV